MNIYVNGEKQSKGVHRMFVEPGRELDGSNWKDKDGKVIQFKVEFVEGKADVPANLGRYMVSRGMATESPIVVANA